MNDPYRDGPSQCPKCGAPTQYTASTDTVSQGYFGTHRYARPSGNRTSVRELVARAERVRRLAALLKSEVFKFAEPDNEKLAAELDKHGVRLEAK